MYKNRQDNGAIGILQIIAAGGTWPKKRKFEAGKDRIEDDRCKWCGRAGQDEYHIFWGCPHINKDSHVHVQGTSYLQNRARRCKENQPCLWLRGLVPYKWTQRTNALKDTLTNINGIDPTNDFIPIGEIYTDGSGGENTKDPRIRSCGCAWIQHRNDGLLPDSDTDACIGQYGTVTGAQTVPRAELTAILYVLAFIKTHTCIGSIIIKSDSKIVVQYIKKGQGNLKGSMGDLWEEY